MTLTGRAGDERGAGGWYCWCLLHVFWHRQAGLAIASFTPSLTRHLGARLDALLSNACRVVITDHSHFVLVNVYVPNAGDRPDRPRLQYKLRFLEALKKKCDALVAQGREVRGLAAGRGWCCRCG